jgi:hypothetical protein
MTTVGDYRCRVEIDRIQDSREPGTWHPIPPGDDVSKVCLGSTSAGLAGKVFVLSQNFWSTRQHHLIAGDTLTLIPAAAA